MARLARNDGVPDGFATQSHRLPWFAAPAILLIVAVVTPLELRRETTMQQLRWVLTEFRKLLISHPRVSSDPARVRFAGLGSYSLDLNVFVYMRTSDINEYYAILEDVLLRMGTILEQAGTGFAIPTRIQWDSDTGLDALRAQAAETRLDELRDNGKLPFPDFDDEERAAFEDKLDYPPKGSPRYRPR